MTQPQDDTTSVARIRATIDQGQNIVFVSGNFNVVHPGHLRLFKFAAEIGDCLVVGVLPDSSSGVTVPAEMRLEGLQANVHIDHAMLLDRSVTEVIAELRPEIVVKGKEFESRENPEQAAVAAYGGKLIFASGEVRFSSLQLLRNEYLQTKLSTIIKSSDMPARRGFTMEDLKPVLAGFAGVRVLVVGDLIVDTYIDCEALGMSQEEPTIVLSPIEQRTFVGGAGIVSLHARGLGAEVDFVTVVGDDTLSSFSRDNFDRYGVRSDLIADDTRPTTHKTRYRAAGKSLLRVNDLRQHAIDPAVAARFLASVDARLPRTDLLLFSDFNYGCLPQPLVNAIVERAAARGVMMMADSQASSQLADISRYRGMTLITPTEREARLATQDFESGLIAVAEQLKTVSGAKHLFVTLGAEGLLIYGDDEGVTRTDRLPAFNTAPRDVAGAGDSLFTTASLALYCGVDVWRSAYLGSLAAACQTSRVGNLPLTVADILAEIDHPDDFA